MVEKPKKFWVIIGEEIHLFGENVTQGGKEEAMKEMRTVLASEPDSSLAEFTYDDEKKEFNIDPVSWKEISQQLAKLLVEKEE